MLKEQKQISNKGILILLCCAIYLFWHAACPETVDRVKLKRFHGVAGLTNILNT